jgi:predicted transcriptional regulator
MKIMKTEQEIKDEIEATKRTIENYRNAYKSGRISREVLKSQLIDCESTIHALMWVLGENDRYD